MSSCFDRLSKPVSWIEGECTTRELIETMMNEIIQTPIKTLGGGQVTSKWIKHYHEREHSYVTYVLGTASRSALYTHTDGKTSTVYKIDIPSFATYCASDGYWYEAASNVPVGGNTKSGNYRTGKRIGYSDFDDDVGLVTLVDMYPERPENTFTNRWEKYQAYIVKHSRINYLGTDVEDKNWNYYKLGVSLGDDWTYAIHRGSFLVTKTQNYEGTVSNSTASTRSSYSVPHFTFTPTLHRVTEKGVLCLMPEGSRYHAYVFFEKPLDSNNYIDISYLVAYSSKGVTKNLVGDPEESYIKSCSISSTNKPTVIDEYEAYLAFERQVNEYYEPGEFYMRGDEGGTLGLPEDIVSHWFFACDSSLTWLPNKMRDKESLVKYSISLNNDRFITILEGDPGYDPDSAYISFGHMGFFRTLDPLDVKNSFAVTVGMGEAKKTLTGFDFKDIDKKTNPKYAGFGRFTSNGMDTISVARGKSSLLYQEYTPAFLTHLPNYPTVGTLPKGVHRLDMQDYYQISTHTDHAHASPIYLVNGYEGYRGYFDGVVALFDKGVVAGDELDYLMEGYTETYVVFRIISPINFLDKSAAPKSMVLAVLKEIK